MKKIISNSGINLIILLISVLSVRLLDLDIKYGDAVLLWPVMLLVSVNLIRSLICFYRGKRPEARSFILSGFLILIIGSASCVTIKFRKKEPKPSQSASSKATARR